MFILVVIFSNTVENESETKQCLWRRLSCGTRHERGNILLLKNDKPMVRESMHFQTAITVSSLSPCRETPESHRAHPTRQSETVGRIMN